MQKTIGFILVATLSLLDQVSNASPWFTGPLLALPAQTVRRGQVTAFFSTASIISTALYNNDWAWVSQDISTNTQISPQLSYGLTDRVDIQYNALYQINQNKMKSYEHIGDASVILGLQALTQQENDLYPDLRITLQEVFPTGIYNRFTPTRNSAEATGMGSYQTSLSLNFQYLSQLSEAHYLNSHISIASTYVAATNINGISSYGGTETTKGHIKPGNAVSLDLAEELTITTKWVAVMEANFIYQQASKFHGVVDERSTIESLSTLNRLVKTPLQTLPAKFNIGQPDIGNGNIVQITLAPALEYNFSANYGVIAGVWFTAAGKNTPEFVTPIFQFTATW